MTQSFEPSGRATKPAASEPSDAWLEDGAEEENFKPLTREEADRWRARHTSLSAWRVVQWQFVLLALSALVGGLVTQSSSVAMSVAYGGLSIALPSAVMAYGTTSSALMKALDTCFPGMAKLSLAGLLFWEGVKVILVLVMLWLAPNLISNLSWLGLVAGLVVVLKAYWLAFWYQARRAV